MSEWQPIETAPHHGDAADRERNGLWTGPIIVFVPDNYGGQAVTAQCDGDYWLSMQGSRVYGDLVGNPTHWQPIPDPPNGTG
jgi:hypothetical protein